MPKSRCASRASDRRFPPAVRRAHERRVSLHYVYLARAADGGFYCGYARRPRERVAAHNAGRGAKILRGKLPVELSFVRRFANKSAALRYECALKLRSHRDKAALAAGWRKTAG